MNKNTIDYKALLNDAMYGVMREALSHVKNDVTPGEHFFYISFLTNFKDVEISKVLKEKYPEQMTIVLQYQFRDLVADEDRFGVTLCFNDKEERISIPYRAVLRFADPSVNIELHFVPTRDENKEKLKKKNSIAIEKYNRNKESVPMRQVDNVISLDKYRQNK